MERKKKTLLTIALALGAFRLRKERDSPSNDRDGECGSLELACGPERGEDSDSSIPARNLIRTIRIASSERCRNISRARTSTRASRPRNVDESSRESEIEQHGKEAKEGNATQTAYQQQGGDGVQNRRAGNALHGSNVGRNMEIVVRERSEEVREDAEDDGSTAELDDAQEEREGLEGYAAEFGHLEIGKIIDICIGFSWVDGGEENENTRERNGGATHKPF
jgi:hypothetical protein